MKIDEGDRIFLGSNSGGVTREYPIQLTEEDREYLNQFELIHMGLYSHVNHLLEELQNVSGKISYDFLTTLRKKRFSGQLIKLILASFL